MRPLAAVATAVLLQGCIYEDWRCPPQEEVEVILEPDWSDAPDAKPEGMACLFYARDGSGYCWRFDLQGLEGAVVRLPAGEYDFVSYNNDTSALQFTGGDTFRTLRAVCRSASIFAGLNSTYRELVPVPVPDDERGARSPDMMWSASRQDVEVTGDGQRIVFRPRQIVAEYTFSVQGVEGLDGVARMCAAMTGMAGTFDLSGGIPGTAAPITVPSIAAATSDSSVGGKFLTFGRSPEAEACELLLMFWLTDGSKHCYMADVTRQIEAAPDPLNVHLRVEGLKLPSPEGSGGGHGGMDVNVDPWHTTVISPEHIPM